MRGNEIKKLLIGFTIITISILYNRVSNTTAGRNIAFPPLMQQSATPPSPLIVSPKPAEPGILSGQPVILPPPVSSIDQAISAQTLLNSLPVAVTTVQKISGQLIPGKVWTMRGPDGEIKVKAGILYQGRVVAVLHFNPLDSRVLPIGMHTRVYQLHQKAFQIQTIKTQLTDIVHKLKILPVAEFRKPETSWIFPIVLGNAIVSHLKVYYDGIHIVPDYPANQEMTYYGQ